MTCLATTIRRLGWGDVFVRFGQEQTFSQPCPRSAMLLKADISVVGNEVRFGPKADICAIMP